MTKKDFFILIIKLFGLLSIVYSLFSVLPSNIYIVLIDMDAISLTWIFFVVIILLGLFVLLIFKSDKIVEALRLDKGFDDERIELGNINSLNIVKIGTFIIGGLLILENIPPFLSHLFFSFRGSVSGEIYDAKDNFYWAVSGVNLVLGYLLSTKYDFVAGILQAKKEEKE